jgi:hypothetical protein
MSSEERAVFHTEKWQSLRLAEEAAKEAKIGNNARILMGATASAILGFCTYLLWPQQQAVHERRLPHWRPPLLLQRNAVKHDWQGARNVPCTQCAIAAQQERTLYSAIRVSICSSFLWISASLRSSSTTYAVEAAVRKPCPK